MKARWITISKMYCVRLHYFFWYLKKRLKMAVPNLSTKVTLRKIMKEITEVKNKMWIERKLFILRSVFGEGVNWKLEKNIVILVGMWGIKLKLAELRIQKCTSIIHSLTLPFFLKKTLKNCSPQIISKSTSQKSIKNHKRWE